MKEFHPSTGYHWKSAPVEGSPTAPTAAAPALAATPATTSAAGGSKAESQEFRFAVDRAIKNVEQRAHMQQFMLQSGAQTGPGGSGAAAAMDPKLKQDGGHGAANAATPKAAPKAANKRRKKSEEASAAAASMGINTSVGPGTLGRLPSAGGGAQTPGPTTPGATPTKRRKKTKNTDPK